MNCFNRFLRYIAIDTASNPTSATHPSSPGQLILGQLLVEELQTLGCENIRQTKEGYVYATVPGNTNRKVPTVGFIAHLDTSPDMSGKDVHPRIIPSYNGQDILLNEKENIILKVSDFPHLKNRQNQTLLVTDGTTLLGADNKAGIAEIMALAETLMKNPTIEHGKVQIAFTPDEEIGQGSDFFDIPAFGADFAFTVDGEEEGSLNFENFNAASAHIHIHGNNIHPGSAKGKMKHALLIAQELQQMLPVFENPMFTENYEGFYHLNELQGTVENAKMHYIIRHHDMVAFNKQKTLLNSIVAFLNEKYGAGTCQLFITDSYYNMASLVEKRMDIIELAKTAIRKENLLPIIKPIRGGTDGARLTFDGLICPNLGTGGHNFHGKYEYITKEGMEKAANILLHIVEELSKEK